MSIQTSHLTKMDDIKLFPNQKMIYHHLTKVDAVYGAMVGTKILVKQVERGQEDAVAYTRKPSGRYAFVYINPNHSLMDGMTASERFVTQSGLNAHEVLHQLFTNFEALENRMKSLPASRHSIAMLYTNVLEDPAIEYFAPTKMGGTMLSSLHFLLAHTHKTSPNIDESQDAFSQYINALIQFGDMGLVKGNFTFPEAKKAFVETIHRFNEGIHEPDGAKRIDIALEIMDNTKYLWETQEKINEMISEMMKNGKTMMSGSGKGMTPDNPENGEGDIKSQRRKMSIMKISNEESDGASEGTQMDANAEDADGDNKSKGKKSKGKTAKKKAASDNADKSEKSNANGKDSEANSEQEGNEEKVQKPDANGNKDDESDGDGADENHSTNNPDKSSDKNKDNSSDDEAEEQRDMSDSKDNPFVSPMHDGPAKKIGNQELPEDFEDAGANGLDQIDNDEYCLSAEDIQRFSEEVERSIEEYNEAKEKEDRIDSTPLERLPITSPRLGKKSCLNYRVKYHEEDRDDIAYEYDTTVAKMEAGIKKMTAQLRRIFNNDREEKEYMNSGRLSVKRMYSSRLTTQVFQRRINPAHKDDFCIEILVDESGSMGSCGKATAARECCIALAESFDRLGIPVYVMGFTADTQGHDVVHNHYVTWNNSRHERLKLMNITARSNNCDGYSIRYATEILKKKNSMHKLLIVLSDGQPAAYGYYDGIADTKQAIMDAKREASVLGVAVGNNDTDTIRHMYEKDFLHISNVNDLFNGVGEKIRRIVDQWK